jgi:hypothetical protein
METLDSKLELPLLEIENKPSTNCKDICRWFGGIFFVICLILATLVVAFNDECSSARKKALFETTGLIYFIDFRSNSRIVRVYSEAQCSYIKTCFSYDYICASPHQFEQYLSNALFMIESSYEY